MIQFESLPPQPPVFIFIEVSPGELAFWSIPDLSLFLFLLSSTPRFSGKRQQSAQNACVHRVLAPRPILPFLASWTLGLDLKVSSLTPHPPASSDVLNQGSSQRRAGWNTQKAERQGRGETKKQVDMGGQKTAAQIVSTFFF